MSSGIPPLPATPPLPGLSPQAEAPVEESDAQIIRLPPELKDVPRNVTLQGVVLRSNDDGSVRIRTPHGDIDVRLSDTQIPPAEGQEVEIDIPRGNPPQSAAVREIADAETPPAPPRSSETPVTVDIHDYVEAPPPVKTDVPYKTLPPEQVAQVRPATAEAVVADAEIALNIILTPVAQPGPAPVQTITAPPAANTATLTAPAAAAVQTLSASLYQPAATVSAVSPLNDLPAFAQSVPAAPPQLNLAPPEPAFTLTPPLGAEAPALFDPEFSMPAVTVAAGQNGLSIAGSTGGPSSSFIPATAPDITKAQVNVLGNTPLQLPEADNPAIAAKENTSNLILQNTQAQALPGIVIGQTDNKLPVVQAFIPALGETRLFTLQTPVENIVPGTPLSIIPHTMPDFSAAVPQTIGASLITVPALPVSFLTPEAWPLMQDTQAAIAQLLPVAAQAFANVIPSPASPASFGPAALFFMAAVRGGDLSQWLGERGIDTLRRGGRGDLLSRLTSEGGALNKLASEPVSQDWRGMSIPLMWQNDIHRMALFYKHDDSNSGDDKKSGRQTRFIFDLKLDQMGKVQIDGLHRGQRLDLILRTEEVLSQSMQMSMRRAYSSALEAAQTTGELSFQNKQEQWVNIQVTNRKMFEAA